MLEIIAAIGTVLTSGAGGGIVGGLFGLFRKKAEDTKELELERLALARDKLDLQMERERRQHEMEMLRAGAEINLAQTELEVEGEISVKSQESLGVAHEFEFKNLNTTRKMDNYRASVRPTLAYYLTFCFSILVIYFSVVYHSEITSELGGKILLALINALIFGANSVWAFYYVSRSNTKQKIQ